MHEDPSSQSIESDEEEDEEEEILGTDDDEQEDPHDYCKGRYFSKLQNNRSFTNLYNFIYYQQCCYYFLAILMICCIIFPVSDNRYSLGL